jgi:hypothetical protein
MLETIHLSLELEASGKAVIFDLLHQNAGRTNYIPAFIRQRQRWLLEGYTSIASARATVLFFFAE